MRACSRPLLGPYVYIFDSAVFPPGSPPYAHMTRRSAPSLLRAPASSLIRADPYVGCGVRAFSVYCITYRTRCSFDGRRGVCLDAERRRWGGRWASERGNGAWRVHAGTRELFPALRHAFHAGPRAQLRALVANFVVPAQSRRLCFYPNISWTHVYSAPAAHALTYL